MDKGEKVIKGLECCLPMTTRNGFADCKQCPYYRKITPDGGIIECCHDLMTDALALLKAQDKTRLVRHYLRPGVYADLWQHCEKCGERLDDGWHPKYCPGCGREVKWNESDD